MGVDSLLEMYTTMYGWYFYGITWDILSSTGILFLPILAVLIENWRDPSESQDDQSAAETSLRRNMIQLPILAFIFMIAAYPAYGIQPKQVRYDHDQCLQNQINRNNIENAERSDGSTFVGIANFSIGQTHNTVIKAPIFWALVTSAGAGLNSYIRGKIGCGLNLRDRYNTLLAINTGDHELNQDIRRFEKECYEGARKILTENKKFEEKMMAKYTRIFKQRHCILIHRHPAHCGGNANQIAADQVKKCLDNPWCEIFFEQGLYSKCEDSRCLNDAETLQPKGLRPFEPVSGFLFDAERDDDYSPAKKEEARAGTMAGTPTCAEWWNSSEAHTTNFVSTNGTNSVVVKPIGLDARLKVHLNQNDGEVFLREMKDRGYDPEVINNLRNNPEWDAVVKAYIKDQQMRAYLDNAKAQKNAADFFGTDATQSQNINNKVIEALTGIFGVIPAAKEAIKFKAMLTITKNVAPMLKAFILMGIYAFLLFYMMLSGYSLVSLLPATFLLISIQLWPSLWQLAIVIDDNLFATMFHNMDTLDKYKSPLLSIFFHMITAALFIILPIVFSTLLTLASASAGRAMAAALGSSGAAAVGLTGAVRFPRPRINRKSSDQKNTQQAQRKSHK